MGSCLSIGIVLAFNNNKNPYVYGRRNNVNENSKYTLLHNNNRYVDSNKYVESSEADKS